VAACAAAIQFVLAVYGVSKDPDFRMPSSMGWPEIVKFDFANFDKMVDLLIEEGVIGRIEGGRVLQPVCPNPHRAAQGQRVGRHLHAAHRG
jgi:hypothetical protein